MSHYKRIDLKVFLGIFLGFFVMFFMGVANASAATIYSHGVIGNDTTGDGSSGNPYKTFHKAYTMASAGDTINLTGAFSWIFGRFSVC